MAKFDITTNELDRRIAGRFIMDGLDEIAYISIPVGLSVDVYNLTLVEQLLRIAAMRAVSDLIEAPSQLDTIQFVDESGAA